MTGKGSALVVTNLVLVLPPRISSPYFVDIVGNVSTSRYRPSTYTTTSNPKNNVKLPSQGQKTVVGSSSMLELTPRYPLMGGWNYTFTVGYDAPLGDYLKKRKGGDYVLAVPFLTPIKDVAFDDVTLRVLLPEGSKCAHLASQFEFDSHDFAQEHSSPHSLPRRLALLPTSSCLLLLGRCDRIRQDLSRHDWSADNHDQEAELHGPTRCTRHR